jgi:hypothetical protein
MRLPRLTTRRLLVLVAVVGIVLGAGQELRRRSARYREISNRHFAALGFEGSGSVWEPAPRWHSAMWKKYDRLARYPWLPVEPDPPPPE